MLKGHNDTLLGECVFQMGMCHFLKNLQEDIIPGSEADLEMLLAPRGECLLRAPEDPTVGGHTEHMGVLLARF